MTTGFGTIDQVMKNLNKEIEKIEGNTMRGLLRAAIEIRGDMEKTPPLIPVATGNLRASWTVVSIYSKNKPVVVCGFTANYAQIVHDNIGAKFQRPGAGAFFFVAAINRNYKRILEIIREEAKIK